MRFIVKNKNAVSPVIAVILMVAITVVLTGVLYYWIQSFSTSNENELAYVGIDLKSIGDDWEISIANVQGANILIDSIELLINDESNVLQYKKSIYNANPKPFKIKETMVYPISKNTSEVISKQTSQPVTPDDSIEDYIGAIFVLKDFNNDNYLNSGDIIRIDSDFNDDGVREIKNNYVFAIKDMECNTRYVEQIL